MMAAAPKQEVRMIAVCEVAGLLGRSVATVKRWHVQYGLPLFREGPNGRLVSDRDEVVRWYREFLRKPQRKTVRK